MSPIFKYPRLTWIVILLSLSVMIIFWLYLIAPERRIQRNIHRNLKMDFGKLEFVKDIKFNSYYIAGQSSDHIYLGNVTAPLQILKINLPQLDTSTQIINLSESQGLHFDFIKVRVDSPWVYVMDGSVPAIFEGNTSNWQVQRFHYDSAYFTDAIPLNLNSFALRSLKKNPYQYFLAKESSQDPHFKANNTLLRMQSSGMFSTDGEFIFDKKLSCLTYLYHYRNQFFCLDTNLNLIYEGKTIDTISQAQIRAAQLHNRKATIVMMAAPPLEVNKRCSVDGPYFYVQSMLVGSGEDPKKFDQSAVIDVYNITNGSYLFSFYLPDFKNYKLYDFQVAQDKLVAIYEHYILCYSLNPSLLGTSDSERTKMSTIRS
ncbi:MAG: hypothetical protein ACXVMS_16845 [Flavisolibacter sp.]